MLQLKPPDPRVRASFAGSRTVIERNGGVLEDERGGKLRFWVPTR
jgi:predicted acetyltransferase